MRKKVLLLYVTPSSGHAQASHALKQAFDSAGGYVVEEYHLLLEWPRFARFLSSASKWILRHFPTVWGYFHGNRHYAGFAQIVILFLYAVDLGGYRSKVRRFHPDVIICAHILPLHILGEAKRRKKIDQPLLVLPTDLWAHRYWYHPSADAYFVATDRAKQDLVKAGGLPDRVFVTGIPVRAPFLERKTRQEALRLLERRDRIPSVVSYQKTILVMGGSYGLLPMMTILKRVIREPDLRVQRWLFLCGHDERMYAEAKRLLAQHRDLPIDAFGFRNDMALFMALADVYLTKPGGLSSTESMVCGLPMVLFKPLPGQERVNARWLVREGVAREARTFRALVEETRLLLARPDLLRSMRTRALFLAKPTAGRDIVRLVRTHWLGSA